MARFRVWHIPQVPGTPFQVETETLEQAVLVLDTLDEYDLFELRERVKPDYSNAAGIERFLFDSPLREEWQPVEDDEIEETRKGMPGVKVVTE